MKPLFSSYYVRIIFVSVLFLSVSGSPSLVRAAQLRITETETADWVFINEVDVDTPGTDTAEFIELYDGGAGNTNLDGLVLVFFNGGDDQSYKSIDLNGKTTDAKGYFVIGNAAVPGVNLTFANSSLQNGADAVALYMGDSTDFPNDTPLTTNNLLDALVYDTDDADDTGLLPLLNSGQPQVNEDGNGLASDTVSLQRCANGTGGKRNTITYEQHPPSPGEMNCPPEINIKRPANTSIADSGTDAQGTKKANEEITLTYTIENTSDNNLSVSNISVSNTSNVTIGTIAPDNLTITAGSTATFNVPYTPAAGSGAFGFELAIANNDPDESNYAITVSGTRDGAAPTVTINQGATQTDPSNTSPIVFDIIFSENVSGFDKADITISGMAGTPGITLSGSDSTYSVAVTGMADGETIIASIPANTAKDSVGNDNTASTSADNSITYDLTAPTIHFGKNTIPQNTSTLYTGATQIQVEFSENVSTASAENPNNYLLLEAGTNGRFDTTSCASDALSDDLKISVDSVAYQNTNPFISILDINHGISLPSGIYRLHVCGTTSIEDLAGIHLNNGTDSLLDFYVAPSSLPATGFRHGRITSLPEQPAAKAYTETALTLEIPKLGVSMPIVGVPQSENRWDVSWLGNNAGYLAGSAFPTWAGNTVITGHVWDAFNRPGAFAEIKNLKYGDQIQIQAWGETYVYEVRESNLLTTKNVNTVLQPEEYDWLTLLTCEFYNPFSREYLFRRAVRAVFVDMR